MKIGFVWYTTKMKPGIDYIGITTPFYCVDGQGHLLMHKRSSNCRDEVGRWDTGAGQLSFGEEVEDCVLREIKEEYGCNGKILFKIHPHSVIRIQNGVKTHWLAIPHIVLVEPEKVKNNEPHKIDDIAWFTLDSLPRPIHSAFRRYILKTNRLDILKQHMDTK